MRRQSGAGGQGLNRGQSGCSSLEVSGGRLSYQNLEDISESPNSVVFMVFMAVHISSVTSQRWCISGLVNRPGMRTCIVLSRGLSEDYCSLCIWRGWVKLPHYDIAFLVCELAYYPGVEVFLQRFSHIKHPGKYMYHVT